jgi:hypothetical protein
MWASPLTIGVLVGSVVLACGSPGDVIGAPAASSGDGGCRSAAECAKSQMCAFPAADGCFAQGTCMAIDPVKCNAVVLGCACDGSKVNIVCTGLPNGYLMKPVRDPAARCP